MPTHLRPPVIHNLRRCVSVCVSPRCPTPPLHALYRCTPPSPGQSVHHPQSNAPPPPPSKARAPPRAHRATWLYEYRAACMSSGCRPQMPCPASCDPQMQMYATPRRSPCGGFWSSGCGASATESGLRDTPASSRFLRSSCRRWLAVVSCCSVFEWEASRSASCFARVSRASSHS